MANDVSNIKVEPVELNWGNPETTRLTAVADVSSNTQNQYYSLYSTDGTLYHAWNNVGAAGSDPAPAGSTEIEVSYAANASAATVAAAHVTAVAAIADFNCKIDPDDSTKFVIQNVGIGAVTAVVTDVDSGFTIVQVREGSNLDLGFIDGDIEFSPTEDLLEIMANQTGTQILDKIRTGNNVDNITVAMKESDAAKLKAILNAGGASVTPSGGTEVTGWGDSKRFLNISGDCRQLILHPVRNAATNRANDFAIWRTYPNLTGFNFSGESEQMINVEFQIIPDPIMADAQDLFVYGDHHQLLLK